MPQKTINQRFSAPRPPLHQLDANVRRSQTSAFAEGTLTNLTYEWVKFLDFCLFYQLQALPAHPHTLCRYAQYVASLVKSHQTVVSYLSGVKTLHLLMNVSTVAFNSFLFRLAMRGMNRLNTHVPHQAPPMTAHLLKDIHKLLDFTKEDDVILWAVLLVGFFLLLRKCNLVPDAANKFNPLKQLKRDDLQFCQDHIKVVLTWTKNNQFREPLKFALPRIPGSMLCPVEALVTLFTLIPGSGSESVFKRSNGSCYSYNNLQTRLASLSESLGLKDKLTSHSLRAGGATNAFLAGVPAEIIKILGFWKSDTYLQYIRMPEEARLAAGVLVKHRIQCLNIG